MIVVYTYDCCLDVQLIVYTYTSDDENQECTFELLDPSSNASNHILLFSLSDFVVFDRMHAWTCDTSDCIKKAIKLLFNKYLIQMIEII